MVAKRTVHKRYKIKVLVYNMGEIGTIDTHDHENYPTETQLNEILNDFISENPRFEGYQITMKVEEYYRTDIIK